MTLDTDFIIDLAKEKIMFATPEQLVAAQKSNIETIFSFSQQAFEGIEKLFELNLNLAKAAVEESADTFRQLLTIKDPQELVAFSAAQAQPTAEKIVNYGRHLYNIAANTQAEFVKTVESQVAETNRKIVSIVEEASKNAPAGSEAVVSMMKSSIAAGHSAYENFAKSNKQVLQAMESNITAAANNIGQAAVKAASAASTVRTSTGKKA